MRLCTHVRFDRGFGKPLKERGLREHISRLKICYGYSIHNKRKHKCSVLLLKFGEFKCKDNIAMLFLLTAFALESKCKVTKKFQIHKIILSY